MKNLNCLEPSFHDKYKLTGLNPNPLILERKYMNKSVSIADKFEQIIPLHKLKVERGSRCIVKS